MKKNDVRKIIERAQKNIDFLLDNTEQPHADWWRTNIAAHKKIAEEKGRCDHPTLVLPVAGSPKTTHVKCVICGADLGAWTGKGKYYTE